MCIIAFDEILKRNPPSAQHVVEFSRPNALEVVTSSSKPKQLEMIKQKRSVSPLDEPAVPFDLRTFPRHDLSVVQVRQHCGCIRQEPAFDDLLCFRNVRFRFSYVVRVVCTESQHDYSIDHCVVRRCIAFGYGGFVPDPVARLPRQSCPVVALTWGQQFRTRVPFCYYDSLGCAHVSLKWQS